MSRRSADIYNDTVVDGMEGKGKNGKKVIDPLTLSNIRDPWSFDPKVRVGRLSFSLLQP